MHPWLAYHCLTEPLCVRLGHDTHYEFICIGAHNHDGRVARRLGANMLGIKTEVNEQTALNAQLRRVFSLPEPTASTF